MRITILITLLLCVCNACGDKDDFAPRENLIGEWEYVLAITQIYPSGGEDTYYSEGWVRLDSDGTGEESTPFSIQRTLDWCYDSNAQEITITPTTIISENDVPVTYEIRRNEPRIQEWYNESTRAADKIIYQWSLTRK